MAKDLDRAEAKKVVSELRASAARLMKKSKELAEESIRLTRRADDLEQLIQQRDRRET